MSWFWGWVGCAAVWDRTPPQVTVDESPGPVRSAAFALVVGDEGTRVTGIAVEIDGGAPEALEVPEGGRLDYVAPPLADGEHRFRFTVTDGALFFNQTSVEAVRLLDNTPPVLAMAPASAVARQGRTWAAWVRGSEPLASVRLTMQARGDDQETKERTVPMYAVGEAWRALRGVEIREEVGPRAVVFEATDAAGNVGRLEAQVEIQASVFEEGGFIRLTKAQTEARKDEAAIEKMREERNAAYAAVVPEQHWRGAFSKPVPEARMTSPFGKYRSYSDGRKSYHTGLDLSEARGAPVLSAAAGEVLVAHEMAIFGNVVIVHHGQGVCTSYNHLDSIGVAAGDQVRAGQAVGTLGSTGQSTGPHLHWGMEVGEVAVDPGEWLEADFSEPPPFEGP